MKIIRPLQVRAAMLAIAVLAELFTITPAHAAIKYWSANGSTAGGDGIWNTTTPNRWATASAGPWTLAWNNANNDIAENSSGTANITLGTNITLGGFNQKAGGSSSANSIEQGAGPYTLTLGITGNNTFSPFANDTTGRFLIVNAAIEGAADKNLLVAGPGTSGTGTLTLNRANTFVGTTTFSGATGAAKLALGNQLALQNSTLILSAPAVIQFNGTAFTLGGLTASSAGTGRNLILQNGASAVALTVGNNNSTTTYKGVLSGSGSIIKTGSGTLLFSAANTYSGNTTISGGTLQVDGSIVGPTTVNSGAVLAGGGMVNAAVTVTASGSVTAGDGTSGSLTVSNLTFNGTGTINVGVLSGYTSAAAIIVSNVLTVSGGAGAVTLNLPTALGFNGTYHLIRFASGPANTNGFKLGTVPTLAWNQTGALQVNGNYLDYVITAAGDTTPPTLRNTLPANNATDVMSNANLTATFDETIVPGIGNIELRRSSNASLVESFDVTSSARLTFSTAQLIIQPTSNLVTNQQYYVLIPFGAVKDTSGNSYAGITNATGWKFTVSPPVVLYTDSGSPTNPPWSQILPTLNDGSNDPGPVYGSLINVNNAPVEVGLYGNRPISVPSQRIHVACNTSTTSFANFTRWFQTDGKTQVLRVFVDDENTATARTGVSLHNEAFMAGGWNYTDNMTYEWTGHYTVAYLKQGYAAFQLKNSDNDWAFQLSMGGSGTLAINNRNGADVTVTNPDGTAKNFNGGGFDMRVLDDGTYYKVWIDGVLYASGSYSRPTGTTTFRWGMYYGANNLNPPADYNMILVSGAQIKSWPGNLATATTVTTKANNTTSLDNGASWLSGVVPGIYKQALWNSTVTAANTTTFASDQQWAGLKIANPGGTVTINGSATLGLDGSGIDMTTATTNLVVNCPVQLTAPSTWDVASGRTATFSGIISGYPGLTLSGGGTLLLNGANIYSGDTTLGAGTLVANNNTALGAGLLVFNGGNLSNSASCTLGNDVNLSSDATVGVGASQALTLNGSITSTGSLTKSGAGTLTLSGANTYSGGTAVNGGTLALGTPSALLTTTSLTLADGTVLQPNLDGVVVSAPITVGSAGTTATISAPINAPGGGVVSTLTLNSVLAGSGDVTFSSSVNQNALSTVYLGGQSTYAGSTKLDTAGTTATQIILKLGINNALPTNTVLTIDGQTGAGTGRFAELNLNGFNQTLAGLTNIARSLRTQRIVNSDVSAAATLTINNSSNYTFSGNLGSSGANGSVSAAAMPGSSNGNNFGLLKNGGGILNLTGTNSYTGNTVVNGGTLQILLANLATSSTVSVAQGAVLQLDFTATNTVAGFITNGVALAPGVYNAGNAAPFIASSGSLRVAGTAPPAPPTIAPVTVSGTNLVVSVATVVGVNYVLQSATNLTPTINWQNESTNAGTGGNLILNVPIEPSQPQKYLRFRLY